MSGATLIWLAVLVGSAFLAMRSEGGTNNLDSKLLGLGGFIFLLYVFGMQFYGFGVDFLGDAPGPGRGWFDGAFFN